MTPRQLQTLEFIEGFWDQWNYGPSYKDIGGYLEVSSPETVRGLLYRLRDNGYVTWSPKSHRSVRSLRKAWDVPRRTPAGGGDQNGDSENARHSVSTEATIQSSPQEP